MNGGLVLTRSQIATLVAQARRDAPKETCGLVGGKGGHALRVFPLANVDEHPVTRYTADPEEQFRALREIEDNGWEVAAIYHSHPATPAFPSPTDVDRAFYPEAVYILISLMTPDLAQVRGFEIREGEVREVTLTQEEDREDVTRA